MRASADYRRVSSIVGIEQEDNNLFGRLSSQLLKSTTLGRGGEGRGKGPLAGPVEENRGDNPATGMSVRTGIFYLAIN